MSSGNQKNVGIRIESSDGVFLDNIKTTGFKEGISVSDTKNFSATNIHVDINKISNDELEMFEEELKNLEHTIGQLKDEKDPKVWEKIIEKLPPLGNELLKTYLKSQGYIE